jgi:hypothetical protein
MSSYHAHVARRSAVPALLVVLAACSSGTEPVGGGGGGGGGGAVDTCDPGPSWGPVALPGDGKVGVFAAALSPDTTVVMGMAAAGGKVFVVGRGVDLPSVGGTPIGYLAFAEEASSLDFKVVPIPALPWPEMAITVHTRGGVEYVEIAGASGDEAMSGAYLWEIDAKAYDGAPLADAQLLARCTGGTFSRPLIAGSGDGQLLLGLRARPYYAPAPNPRCAVGATTRTLSLPTSSPGANFGAALIPIQGTFASTTAQIFDFEVPESLSIAGEGAQPRIFLSTMADEIPPQTRTRAFDWGAVPAGVDAGVDGDWAGLHGLWTAVVADRGFFGGTLTFNMPGQVKLFSQDGATLVEQPSDAWNWLGIRALHGGSGVLALGGESDVSGISIAGGSTVRCAKNPCAFAASLSFPTPGGNPRLGRVLTVEGADPTYGQATVSAVFTGKCGQVYVGGAIQDHVEVSQDGTVVGALDGPTSGAIPFVAKTVAKAK